MNTTHLIHCGFCRSDMTKASNARRRLRNSHTGKVFCSMKCRTRWIMDGGKERDQQRKAA